MSAGAFILENSLKAPRKEISMLEKFRLSKRDSEFESKTMDRKSMGS